MKIYQRSLLPGLLALGALLVFAVTVPARAAGDLCIGQFDPVTGPPILEDTADAESNTPAAAPGVGDSPTNGVTAPLFNPALMEVEERSWPTPARPLPGWRRP